MQPKAPIDFIGLAATLLMATACSSGSHADQIAIETLRVDRWHEGEYVSTNISADQADTLARHLVQTGIATPTDDLQRHSAGTLDGRVVLDMEDGSQRKLTIWSGDVLGTEVRVRWLDLTDPESVVIVVPGQGND